ncbi:MAG: PASTA domain-containing protein [candidate division FCPU426 bacterium]
MKGESRYWIRLLLSSLGLGALVFYLMLNLSVKGGKAVMPDLKGLNRTAAERALRSAGLHMAVKSERFVSGQPAGAVVEQDIEAGTTVKRGRNVSVVLSKGAKSVAVPGLKGLTSSRQAGLLLDQNGLVLGVQDFIHDDSEKDTVVAQSPEAGVELPRGTAVSLLVSLGRERQAWVMPDLRRGDAEAARDKARRMGLILRGVTEKDAPQSPPGSVLSQSLRPGARVEEGSELNLVVATGGSSSAPARLVRIEYKMPDGGGGAEKRVRIVVTDVSGQRPAYNSMARPGEKISVELRVRGKASYVVNLSGQDLEERELP